MRQKKPKSNSACEYIFEGQRYELALTLERLLLLEEKLDYPFPEIMELLEKNYFNAMFACFMVMSGYDFNDVSAREKIGKIFLKAPRQDILSAIVQSIDLCFTRD